MEGDRGVASDVEAGRAGIMRVKEQAVLSSRLAGEPVDVMGPGMANSFPKRMRGCKRCAKDDA